MEKQHVERYLAELGQELSNLGIRQPVRILIIGGIFMLEQVGNRSITEDIDVFFKDIQDRRNSPLYQTVSRVVKEIGVRHNLREDWLNDGFSHVLRTIGEIPEGSFWRSYGVLEAFFPPADYVLALKLLGYRDKDRTDIEALCQILQIQTRQQARAAVNQYVPNTEAHEIFHLEQTLDELF